MDPSAVFWRPAGRICTGLNLTPQQDWLQEKSRRPQGALDAQFFLRFYRVPVWTMDAGRIRPDVHTRPPSLLPPSSSPRQDSHDRESRLLSSIGGSAAVCKEKKKPVVVWDKKNKWQLRSECGVRRRDITKVSLLLLLLCRRRRHL